MISLSTLPGFSPSFLHKFRQEVIQELKYEVDKLSFFYVKNKQYKTTEEKSKLLIDQYKLGRTFLKKEFYKAFVGTSQYAKSFLTSEYLHKYFSNNPLFDYTPIVSGYIKSVEQLLHVICKSYLHAHKVNNSLYKTIANYTLSDYMTFLDEKDVLFIDSMKPNKKIIIDCLNSYRAESRNRIFHKDYFNTWERVEQIRANTIFIYVVLLSAINPIYITPYLLGIIDDKYDTLFYTLETQSNLRYSVLLEGKEYNGMTIKPRNEGIMFNNNGQIRNTIIFTKYEYDHYEEIEISNGKLPTSIWVINTYGEKVKKVF